jgi:hypothetical protein
VNVEISNRMLDEKVVTFDRGLQGHKNERFLNIVLFLGVGYTEVINNQ